MPRFLDPRFRAFIEARNDPNWTRSAREIALTMAREVARDCGFQFDEALAKSGVIVQPLDPKPVEYEQEPALSVHRPATTFPPLDAKRADAIKAALTADPSRSDRDVARAIAASPTTIGRVRRALGLGTPARSITRKGVSFRMALGALARREDPTHV